MNIIYRASDGTEFNNAEDCKIYEDKKLAQYELLEEIVYIRKNSPVKFISIKEVQEGDMMCIPNNNYVKLSYENYIKTNLINLPQQSEGGCYLYQDHTWINLENTCKQIKSRIDQLNKLLSHYTSLINFMKNRSAESEPINHKNFTYSDFIDF